MKATFLALCVFDVACSRPRLAAPCEVAAIRRIEQMNTAQAQFFSQYQRFGAADELDLPELMIGMCEVGYSYTIQLRPHGYSIEARPGDYPSHGHRCFYSDETFMIRQVWKDAPATASDPELR